MMNEYKHLEGSSKRTINERFAVQIKANGVKTYYPGLITAAKKQHKQMKKKIAEFTSPKFHGIKKKTA